MFPHLHFWNRRPDCYPGERSFAMETLEKKYPKSLIPCPQPLWNCRVAFPSPYIFCLDILMLLRIWVHHLHLFVGKFQWQVSHFLFSSASQPKPPVQHGDVFLSCWGLVPRCWTGSVAVSGWVNPPAQLLAAAFADRDSSVQLPCCW